VAVAYVEPSSGVTHAARQATSGGREIPERRAGAARNSSVRRLQSDEAGESGGNPNRAAAVPSGRQRDETAGDGGSTAA